MSDQKIEAQDYNAKIQDNKLVIEGSCTLAYNKDARDQKDIQMINYTIREDVSNGENLSKTLARLWKGGAPGTRVGKSHTERAGLTKAQYDEFLEGLEYEGTVLYGSDNKEIDCYKFEGTLNQFETNPFETGSKSLEDFSEEELKARLKALQEQQS